MTPVGPECLLPLHLIVATCTLGEVEPSEQKIVPAHFQTLDAEGRWWGPFEP